MTVQKHWTKVIKKISAQHLSNNAKIKSPKKPHNMVIFLIKVRGSYRGLSSQADPTGDNREFKITTTATGTGTSLNKRFNEKNNGCARVL